MSTTLLPGPFAAPGNWYRGALHAHTTESDGGMPPERLLRHYRQGGWDFVALTDHRRVTDRAKLSEPDFLVLRGIELDVGRSELGHTYHVVGIGVEAGVAQEPGWAAQDAVDAIVRAGGVATLAHPYWLGLGVADLQAVAGFAALEVYNATCELEISRGYSNVHWDALLSRGKVVRAVAVDDTHNPGFDSLRGWTMVRAPELSAPAIVEALRLGHFYASTGPEIHGVTVTADRIEVECSPARTVALVCDPTRGARVSDARSEPTSRAQRRRGPQSYEGLDASQLLTGAVFPLRGVERYARVQVTDAQGRIAWTNPLLVRREA